MFLIGFQLKDSTPKACIGYDNLIQINITEIKTLPKNGKLALKKNRFYLLASPINLQRFRETEHYCMQQIVNQGVISVNKN